MIACHLHDQRATDDIRQVSEQGADVIQQQIEHPRSGNNNGNKYGDDFWYKRQRHFVDLCGGLQNTDDKARDQRHQQQRGS